MSRFDSLPTDLAAIESLVWTALEQADGTPRDPWSLVTLVTRVGEGVNARTLVIRDASRERAQLILHTDIRSPKVQQLQRNPQVCLHLYDWYARVQVVMQGEATVTSQGAGVDTQWQQSAISSRRAYLAPAPPGIISDDKTVNLPPEFQNKLPTESQLAPGRNNFAVITCAITEIDFLCLQSSGNARARFHLSGNDWQAEWLMA